MKSSETIVIYGSPTVCQALEIKKINKNSSLSLTSLQPDGENDMQSIGYYHYYLGSIYLHFK